MSRNRDGRPSQHINIPNIRSKLREFLDKQRLIKMEELDSMGGKMTRRRPGRTQRQPSPSRTSPMRRARTTPRTTGGY